jgi:hypothetical protein
MSKRVENTLTPEDRASGKYIGVTYDKHSGRYKAYYKDPLGGQVYVGLYGDKDIARDAIRQELKRVERINNIRGT